jgi:hypothetical protein
MAPRQTPVAEPGGRSNPTGARSRGVVPWMKLLGTGTHMLEATDRVARTGLAWPPRWYRVASDLPRGPCTKTLEAVRHLADIVLL